MKTRSFIVSSFRAKVLVPVIVVMVLLMATTSWVLHRRITRQMETEARRALGAAGEGFRDWRYTRTRNLLLRLGDLRNEPRYRAAFQTGDSPTIRAELNDLLNTADAEVQAVFYGSREHKLLATVKRDPLMPSAELESGIGAAVSKALHGDETVDTVEAGGKLFDVVAIPVFSHSGDTIGALSFALELGNGAALELSRFTRSQIVFLAGDRVVVSTLLASDAGTRFAGLFRTLSLAAEASSELRIQDELLDGQHFYCSAGKFSSSNISRPLGYLLLYGYEDAWHALETTHRILWTADVIGILLASVAVCFLVGRVTSPLLDLRRHAEAVGQGDFSRRVEVTSSDECGELAQVFNQMTDNLRRSREQLEGAQADLVEASRRAGIAEVATGVLHNVGNVLNSVNVASALMEESLKKSRAANLGKLVMLLRQHQNDLGTFLTQDAKGRKIPDYLAELSSHLINEQEATLRELAELQKGIEHIRDIVRVQQSYAKVSSVAEEMSVAELVEDALRMNLAGKTGVRFVQELEPGLMVKTSKHKVLQILVNLIRNAKQACDTADASTSQVTVKTGLRNGNVSISVTDTGVGIAPENAERIFKHGFTTKKDGHGFGLHSSAAAAKELGGSLRAASQGVGKGATFTLELPAQTSAAQAANRNAKGAADVAVVR